MSPSCRSMVKCSCWLPKLRFPPYLLSPLLDTKSTGVQYFPNFWDLLHGEEGRERVDAEQPPPASLWLSIYPSLNKPVLSCQIFHVEVSILYVRHESSWGVRVGSCQKIAGVTDYLGSKQQVWCSLFYVSVSTD